MSVKIEDLVRDIVRIRTERDWDRFHTPKNIAISLSIEASELLEIFTWKTDDESKSLSEKDLLRIKNELGDILFNLINISEILGINLLEAGRDKANEIEIKYPKDECFGSAKKYNEI